MDPLTQLMLQRQLASSPPGASTPVVPPASAGKTHTPPAMQRFKNAQALMQAYRNNWTPNPMLLRASQK